MKDIFAFSEDSPELQIFETMSSVNEFEDALYMYYLNRELGMSQEEAVASVVADVIPSRWLNLLENQ